MRELSDLTPGFVLIYAGQVRQRSQGLRSIIGQRRDSDGTIMANQAPEKGVYGNTRKAVWNSESVVLNQTLCYAPVFCRRNPAGHVVLMEYVFCELWRRLANSRTFLHDVWSQQPMHRPFERESTLQQHCRLPRYFKSHTHTHTCQYSFVRITG